MTGQRGVLRTPSATRSGGIAAVLVILLVGNSVPLRAQDRCRVLSDRFVERASAWSWSFVLVMPLAPLVP